MNRFENLLGKKTPAKIKYCDNEFQVTSPGDFVLCAVTGKPIKLEQLKYWSVERQEAYLSADVAMQLERQLRESPNDET